MANQDRDFSLTARVAVPSDYSARYRRNRKSSCSQSERSRQSVRSPPSAGGSRLGPGQNAFRAAADDHRGHRQAQLVDEPGPRRVAPLRVGPPSQSTAAEPALPEGMQRRRQVDVPLAGHDHVGDRSGPGELFLRGGGHRDDDGPGGGPAEACR